MEHAITEDQRAGETQRANILEAARHVFARRGKAATMADIAQAASVSQGLAYRYFESKEQIYRELVEQALEQAALAMALPSQESATPGQNLAALITQLVEYRRNHLEVFQLLDQVLGSGKPPDAFVDLIRRSREGFFHQLRTLIVDGQASGEVAPGNPDQLVFAIAAMLEGLTRSGLHHPEQFQQLCPDPSIVLRMLKA